MKKDLREIIRQRILVLDGAMGTMIQTYGLTEDDFRGTQFAHFGGQMKGNNDVLCLTRPDVVTDIHRRYLKAGADLIETNTFSAQRISQADYHLEASAAAMAYEGARLARLAADEFSTDEKPRFVLGAMGPTNKTASMSPDVNNPAARNISYDQLCDAYLEQAEALVRGGIDAFLIETIFDTLNAKAAIDAARQAMQKVGKDLPVMLSVTIADKAGRTLSGQTLDAFLATISGYDVFSVGLNCSFGAREMKPYLKELARRSPYYISAYPNAGLPNEFGQYDETADSMAPQIEEYLDEHLVNIIGGCCGTNDEFISRYAAMAVGREPHQPAAKTTHIQLAGLDPLDENAAFVNVGERCNVAGSRKFLRLINEKSYEEAMSIARKQVEDGALVIDINMDDGLLDARKEMVTFLNLIASDPDIARVPVMLDSSDWRVIEAALKCVQGKCIVNSISLKEGEDVFKAHARDVKRFGAAVVVMCFDESGQATTYDRRIEIASRSYKILTEEVGLHPQDIIFDPNILAIATGMEEHDAYALDFIRATRWIRENLPGAHVSGGVSNLSFSFRGNNYIREAMHAVFLYHAIQAGMDFGIVNPASKVAYEDIPTEQLTVIEDVVLNRRKGAAEDLIELANRILAEKDAEKNAPGAKNAASAPQDSWRQSPLNERLAYALRKGIGDHLQTDLTEALQTHSQAVDIIEGPLMAGMNEVGRLFGEGKMFLPQVVKTARTMKQAVAILQPYIEQQNADASAKSGKIVLATVKGDVHDIGKNIVAVVMACNNYDVIDLGVMVPAEDIVSKAIEEKADAIGLSGLITPSLEEMVNVAMEMERAGLKIPIMIGGATTSAMHVALKIAPVYSGPVVWVKDAAQNVVVISKMLSTADGQDYCRHVREEQELLRRQYVSSHEKTVSFEEARRNKLNLF
ncbi:MAG: methionine synthase [Prevotella sp.]|nr:methionine synthase [Prevotella sp.]